MTGIENVRPKVNATPLNPLRLLRRTEAAEHIQQKWGYPCSPRTLAKYAVVGGGPPFRKAGRYPLYHPDDLDRWVSDKLSDPVTSTSELAADSSSRRSIKSRGQGATVVGTNGFVAPSNGLAPGRGHESPMAPRPPPSCHYPPDEHSQSSTNQ